MIADVAVLIPVLGRPHRVAPLLDSLLASERILWLQPYFLVSEGDDAEIAEIVASGEAFFLTPGPVPGDYAKKMNLGVRKTLEPWIFLAADDLCFCPGWADEAVRVALEDGKRVVGTMDEGNAQVKLGKHSTHTLLHRSYVSRGTIDNPSRLLHEGYDHNFCNPPEAPIWMADLSFRNLGDVRVGDEVMGWERSGVPVGGRYPGRTPLRRLCASEVVAVGRREAELVSVILESGRTIRCTPDHNWLNSAWSPSSSHCREWVTPKPGRQLLRVVDGPPQDTWDEDQIRLAGWLAGIYDGEGSGVYVATQCRDKNPDVYEAIRDALDELEVPYSLPESGRSVGYFNLTGGRQGYLNFLLRIKPVRRSKLEARIKGSARFGFRDRVISVEPDGSGEVVSLTTSTGNYVAWGYASKNCDNEFVETAKHRDEFTFAARAVVEHLHPNWKKGDDDQTYRRGMAHFAEDGRLFRQREALIKSSS